MVFEQLKIAAIFLTRLRLNLDRPIKFADLTSAVWAFPIVGAAVGAFSAAVFLVASASGVPSMAATALALAGAAALTRGLHEEGLARAVEGLSTSGDRSQVIEAMRAGRMGAPAVVALVFTLLIKVTAYADFWDPIAFFAIAVIAHASSRAAMAVIMRLAPAAHRAAGQSAEGARPSALRVAAAVALALALTLALYPFEQAVVTLAIGAVFATVVTFWAIDRIDGVTGDVLGASQQAFEIGVVLTASALFT